MIRLIVVEDSPVAREYLVHIFEADPEITVIGTAKDGAEAVELAGKLRPDVITMDVNMPVMDGLEATRRIMETYPAPIVIVSGVWDPKEVATTFRAVEAGALAVVQRPAGIGHPDSGRMQQELISKVKLMSEVRVVRRWPRPRPIEKETRVETAPALVKARAAIDVVAVGASTGGPLALRTILSGLPADFPIPLLIVQHIAAGFIRGMVEWLSATSGPALHIASEGHTIQGGHAYFAPDGFEMGVDRGGLVRLRKEGSGAMIPTVSYLFRSVMDTYGPRSAGVLLTGMGRDGAHELKLMREKGALTIAQDEESSVVFGMPGEAVRAGAAEYVWPPDKIARALTGLGEGACQRTWQGENGRSLNESTTE